jgi:hypothetical protein
MYDLSEQKGRFNISYRLNEVDEEGFIERFKDVPLGSIILGGYLSVNKSDSDNSDEQVHKIEFGRQDLSYLGRRFLNAIRGSDRYGFEGIAAKASSSLSRAKRKAAWREGIPEDKASDWSYLIKKSFSRKKKDTDDNTPKDPVPPHLEHVTRKGAIWRKDNKPVDGEMLMETFGFSGIEFGNSLPNKERQEVLNHAYDSFMDLARITGLNPSDMSLNGKLALAFGSRGIGGRKNVVAHYEPDSLAINLTRLRGAGTLAHEWFHALDNYIGTENAKGRMGVSDYMSSSTAAALDPQLNPIYREMLKINRDIHNRMETDEEVKSRINSEVSSSLSHGSSWFYHYFVDAVTPIDDDLDSRKARYEVLTKINIDAGDKDITKEIIRFNVENNPTGSVNDIAFNSFKEMLAVFSKKKSEMEISGDLNKEQSLKLDERLTDIHKRVEMLDNAISTHDEDRGWTRSSVLLLERLLSRKCLSQMSISVSRLKTNIRKLNSFEGDGGAINMRSEKLRKDSHFYDNAIKLDEKKPKNKKYWSTDIELAARAFEAWVYDKMDEKGQHNDYLSSNAVPGRYASDNYKGNPYPEGEERAKINAGFDQLMTHVDSDLLSPEPEDELDDDYKQQIAAGMS